MIKCLENLCCTSTHFIWDKSKKGEMHTCGKGICLWVVSLWFVSELRHSWSLFLCIFLLVAVLMWRMGRLQDAVLWIHRPPLARGSSCTPTSPKLDTTSGESPSCTAQTATTTSHPNPCPATPLSPRSCKLIITTTITMTPHKAQWLFLWNLCNPS